MATTKTRDLQIVRYVANPKSGLSDDDATVIGTYLVKEFGDGPVAPRELVIKARPATSPIHGYFEWNDKAAAAAHRLTQARYLLRQVDVVFTSDGIERPPTRAYHNVVLTSEGAAGLRTYVPAQVIWASGTLSKQVVAQARRDLLAFVKKFRDCEELAGIVETVEQLIISLEEDLGEAGSVR